MNILLICFFFLLLFAAALWPLLFRNSTWKNLIFAGSNIISLILLFSLGANISENREKIKECKEKFRTTLLLASEIMKHGKTPPPGFRITETNVSAATAEFFKSLDDFGKDVRRLYKITRSPGLPPPASGTNPENKKKGSHKK